ncbi:MAG: DMT family transporter [Asticcacaulis sp.]|uniref:DMT family transporter n=1 Tax=Asticcacaulis sp. TaxID=1872648 RepID=UPI0039E371C2
MDRKTIGWINGGLGVLTFSGSLPATKVAVQAMSPLFLTSARAVIAAGLAAICLIVLKAARPEKRDIASLIGVALGVVVGFPLLSAMALQHIPSVHSIVFTGLLPISTAVFASLLGEKHPPKLFWLFSGLGGVCIIIYALTQGFSVSPVGDLLMLAAIIVCGFGYAEGARLSRKLGGWQVICWALLVAAPVMLALGVMTWPNDLSVVHWPAWLSLGYVSLFSMLIGFIFWYRGLALGGIAAVGQLQLMQPFLALILAACLLKEPISWAVVAVMVAIVACVAGARRFAS